MKLSKKKALEICRELWLWLEKSGSDCKWKWGDWKKYKKYGIDEEEVSGFWENCPCCEYVRQSHCLTDSSTLKCRFCPLISLWEPGCQVGESPFHNWEHYENIRARKKYARIIRKGCEKELKKLKRKRK